MIKMVEKKRMTFQSGAIILPKGFTFAYHLTSCRDTQQPFINYICVINFMAINWLGDGYAYYHESYDPVFVNQVFTGWRLDGHGKIYSKHFSEGHCSFLSEDLFEQFRQSRISKGSAWLETIENEKLFCDLKNTNDREVVWVNNFPM